MTGVLIKMGNWDTDKHSERIPREGKGRGVLKLLQENECQRLPANQRKLKDEEACINSLLQSQKGPTQMTP